MEIVKYDDVLQLKNSIFDCIDVTENTRKEYLTRIKHFVHFVKLHGLNFNTYLEYKRYLSSIDTLSVSTKNKYLISAKIFIDGLNSLQRLPFQINTKVRGFKQSKLHKKDGLCDEDISKIVEYCSSLEPTIQNLRLKSILSLLIFQGLRQVEITRLNVADINLKDKTAFIIGKGQDDKELIHLHPSTVKPVVTLATNTYDELGRLKTNQKHGHANLKTTYAYNIRSWTKSISSPLFNQTLYYNDKVTAHTYSDYVPQYNGNISGMEWQVQGDNIRSNRFKYDNLSRLTHSAYNGVSSGGSYNTYYTYDKHGNITYFGQRGLVNTNSYGEVDNLYLSYNGNQLKNTHNKGVGTNLAETEHFHDFSKDETRTKIEYTYNKNGAMTKDLNKGISQIQYNSLNLPRILDVKSPVGEARNEYLYSASGVKLQVVQRYNSNYNTAPINGTDINLTALDKKKTTDYVGNKIYEAVSLGTIRKDGNKRFNLDGTTNNTPVNSATKTIASTFAPGSRLGGNQLLKGASVRLMNASSFSKTFKGTLSGLSSTARGYINRQINQGVRIVNNAINSPNPYIKTGAALGGVINTINNE